MSKNKEKIHKHDEINNGNEDWEINIKSRKFIFSTTVFIISLIMFLFMDTVTFNDWAGLTWKILAAYCFGNVGAKWARRYNITPRRRYYGRDEGYYDK